MIGVDLSVWTASRAQLSEPPAASAPTVTASDSLEGRTLTITITSLTGSPAPTASLTTLTLGGADVLEDATGTGPWSYVVPDSADDETVAWEVTATNSEGSDTASGSEVVPANLTAPAQMDAPTLTGGEEEANLVLGPAPDDGGSAITSYEYEVDEAAGDFSDPIATGTVTPANRGNTINLAPLAAGSYKARNLAGNAIDDGPWSAASADATVTASAVTDAPTVAATGRIINGTLFIEVTDVTGAPAPATTLTSLTLDGVDVLADAMGGDPLWQYKPPIGASLLDVTWEVTATNSEGSATVSGFASDAPWEFVESWADDPDEIYQPRDQYFQTFLVSDSASPSGIAMEYSPEASATGFGAHAPTVDFSGGGDVIRSETFIYFRTPPTDLSRFFMRHMSSAAEEYDTGSAGIMFRIGTVSLKLPGEDSTGNAPVNLGRSYDLDTEYYLRVVIDGDTVTATFWEPSEAEPKAGNAGFAQRQHSGPIDTRGFKFGHRLGVSETNPVTVLGWSIGLNAPAPTIGVPVIPPAPSDLMECQPSEDIGASGSITINEEVTFTVEDV